MIDSFLIDTEVSTKPGQVQFREAIATVQKGLAFDGLNLGYLSVLTGAQMALRDDAAAEQTVNRIAQIDPRSELTASGLSTLRLLQGRYAESLAECPKISNEQTRLSCVAHAQHSLGHRAQADQAFAWFDKAVAARESDVSQILIDRTLDGLHKDPRGTAQGRMRS